MDIQNINNEVKNEIEMRINPSDFSLNAQDLMDILNSYNIDEGTLGFIYSQVVEEMQKEANEISGEVMDYFRSKENYYPSFEEFKKVFNDYDNHTINDEILRSMHKKEIKDINQLSLYEIIKDELKKVLSESNEDLGIFSGAFDADEFDGDAMKAAMQDMGKEFVPLGQSSFETQLDPEELKADLKRQNLNLPSDAKEIAKIAKMMNKKSNHEKKFGAGSLNEEGEESGEASLFQIKDAQGNIIKRNLLVKPVGGIDKKGRVMGFADDGKGNMQVIVNWAWPVEMKFTNPKEMGKENVYPETIILASAPIKESDWNEGPQPGDEEYHINRSERFSGLSKFKDIDWAMIHPILVNNTKELKYKKPIDDITFSVNNFEEVGVSKEDLELLNDRDVIYIWDRMPIIDNETYLDYNNFLSAAKNAWDKGFSNDINKNDSETPYLRGRELDETNNTNMENEIKENKSDKIGINLMSLLDGELAMAASNGTDFNIYQNRVDFIKNIESRIAENDWITLSSQGQLTFDKHGSEIDEARGVSKVTKNTGDRNVKLRDDHHSAPLTNLNESVNNNIKKLLEGKVTKKQLQEFISEQAKEVAKKLI